MEPRWHRSTFPTERHARVHSLIGRLVSEGTAHFFADACDISQRQPPYRTSRHLIGHLIREVESALREVLVSLPEVKQALAVQPDKDNANHVAEINAILEVLGLHDNEVATSWRTFAGKKTKGGWHRNAHRDDLQFPRGLDEEFASRFDLFIDVLVLVLDAAEGNYASVLRALAVTCAKASPSSADLDFVAKHVAPGAAAVSHVFAELQSSWLVPLRDRGVFDAPPDVQFHEGGSYSFPHWPQASFLERIAADLPEEVATTIERVPLNDNETLHWVFLRTAVRMPASVAKRVALYEVPWLGARSWRQGPPLPHTVQNLITHLVAGNELDAAFELLRPALTLLVDEDESVGWRERKARMSDWDFEELVRNTVGALGERNSQRTKAFLIELLDAGQKSESSWWRQAVEDHGQNRFSEPLDHIFVELRKIFERDVERTGERGLRDAVAELEARPSGIYGRLALHLLRRFGQSAPDLVVERATNQALLDSVEHFHEVASMIEDRFSGLTEAEQRLVVDALRVNSSLEHIRSKFDERLPTEDQQRRHADIERRKWFAILGAHRPVDVEQEYITLCAGRGEVEHPTFSSWHGDVRSGPNAPITAPELAALSDSELLQYLKAWVPATEHRFEPSRSGLGLELKKCVMKEPSRFAALARELRGHHPQYVGHLLWALQEVSKPPSDGSTPESLTTLEWDSMLDLAEWAANQETAGDDSEDANPRAWTWARRGAVDVAENAAVIQAKGAGGQFAKAWGVIRRLLRDKDPTPERVAENKMDDETFAINTVRGQAIHAAIVVAAALKGEGSSHRPGIRDEVLAELEKIADAAVEPSQALRGVLAQRFTSVFIADKELAGRIARDIFPSEAAPDAERIAMWGMFVEWNGCATELFDALRNHYAWSVAHLGEMKEKAARPLAEHLIWLGAWGVSGVALPDGLLVPFVASASMSLRHHALETLGRAIHHEEKPLPTENAERLKRLWSWWSSQGAGEDLAAFGWWMSSPAFDAAWIFSNLPRVLEISRGALDWDHAVCDKLAALASQYPREVAGCLAKVVDSDHRNRVHRCGKAIRKALEALRAGPAAELAKEIAARLVARKHPEYRDLMA